MHMQKKGGRENGMGRKEFEGGQSKLHYIARLEKKTQRGKEEEIRKIIPKRNKERKEQTLGRTEA
jgi:hypothetical protein